MKHIGIFNNSGDVQTAIANETLENPYVAMVSGSLDYNSVVPAPPVSYMAEWSAANNNYTFQLLETGSTYWADQVIIASALNVSYQNAYIDMPVKFDYNGSWRIIFQPEGESSEIPEHIFYGQETWEVTDVLVDAEASDGYVCVDFDGVDSFTFHSNNNQFPLSMTTINPEYPAGE